MRAPAPARPASRDIVVVGAGVIGVTVAHALQQRGFSPILIDRSDPGRGASFGNMASIAVSEFLPSSRPSIWRQLPRWLLDRNGPVRLSPTYLPRLTPWLLRFLSAGRPSHVAGITTAGARLCARVYEDLLPLLADAGVSDALSHEGCLSLYRNEAELAADHEHLEALERFGCEHHYLDGNELRELEPALAPDIHGAVLLPHNRSIKDPLGLVLALFNTVMSRGGRFVRGTVTGFDRDDGLQAVRLAEAPSVAARRVVICAGAHSAPLARALGEPIPLESERGYHTQIMQPGVSLRHSIIWPARAFMVTPTAGGIRVGGTVEMSGLKAGPDFRRAKVLVRRAQEVLPRLETGETTEWMGHRPALPDTVPIISPSARVNGIWYATGHGHLGLTLAATTARLIADLVAGETPPIDMRPYRVDRF